MDIEKLIDDLDELVVIARNDENIGVSKWLELNGSVADVKELLEKQIPKAIARKDLSESYKCPNCNEDRHWKDGICCKDCGQLLDWRND